MVKAFAVLLLCLLTSPAYAGPGQVRALAVMGGGYPASVTTTFLAGDWQGWTTSGTVGFDTGYYRSPSASAWLVSSASITKTVVTGEGEFAVWTQFQEGATPTCTFQIDSGTPVNCAPSTSFSFQQFTQAITAGTHTLAIAGTPNLRVDDASYPHPQLPLWPSTTAINGVTTVADTGPTDTESQTGVTSAGNATFNVSCSSANVGDIVSVKFVVDGAETTLLTCNGDIASTSTSVAISAGSHTLRLYIPPPGTGSTASATITSIPAP